MPPAAISIMQQHIGYMHREVRHRVYMFFFQIFGLCCVLLDYFLASYKGRL